MAVGAPGPNAQQWEAKKELIRQLYQVESRNLGEVRKIVVEKDPTFIANERMYKTRIRNWGLKKNYEKDVMHAMILKKRSRETEGKQTAFRLQGVPVAPERLENYRRKKRKVVERTGNTGEREPSTPSDLSCYTPKSPASPKTACIEFDLGTAAPSLRARLSSVPVPLSATITEIVLKNVVVYLDSKVESGCWFYDYGFPIKASKGIPSFHGRRDPSAITSDNIFNSSNSAFSLLRRGKFREGCAMLNEDLKHLGSVLRYQDPFLVPRILELLATFGGRSSRKFPDIQPSVLRYITEMCQIIFGSNHPLLVFFSSLRQSQEMNTILSYAYQTIADVFQRHLGSDHMHALDIRMDFAGLLSTLGKQHEAERILRPALRKLTENPGVRNELKAQRHVLLAHILYQGSSFEEAELEIQTSLSMDPSHDDAEVRSDRLWLRHLIELALGRPQAEQTLRMAATLSSEQLGPRYSTTLRIMNAMEEFLEDFGRDFEAGEVAEAHFPAQMPATVNSESLVNETSHI